MESWKSLDDVLDFAMDKEQEAVDFYAGLAERSKDAHSRRLFEGFAREEQGHKAKLEAIKRGKVKLAPQKKVMDLKVGDYLVDVEATPDLDYQHALIVAMKREKAAFRLYTDLAEQVDDAQTRGALLLLAQEEAKHKLRFEIEYDDNVYSEN